MQNRTILEKAQMALSELQSNGGYLPEATAKKFILSVVKQGVLLQLATVVPMTAPEMTMPKIKFGSRILHAANPATALSEAKRSKPTTDKVTLNAKEFKAEVRLDYSVLEDNIEGEALQQTVMGLMKDRVALDIDEIATLGDTASTDPDLAVLDGIFKQITSHTVDAGGVAMSKTILGRMMTALPQEYRKNKAAISFLMADANERSYREQLGERATGAGDRYISEDAPVFYMGSPVQTIPVFPENQGQTTNRSTAIYTNPKNVAIGICKNVMFESDKDISAGELIVVARVRFDVKLSEELAAVKAYSILAA